MKALNDLGTLITGANQKKVVIVDCEHRLFALSSWGSDVFQDTVGPYNNAFFDVDVSGQPTRRGNSKRSKRKTI